MPRSLAATVAVFFACVCVLPAQAEEPPAEALLAELPFLDSPNESANRIYVNLAPEGSRALRMLLDTGAAPNVITPLYARSLGVSVRRDKSSPYRRPTLLGRDLQFWIDTRRGDTGSKTGWEYGLLGGEFLKAYVLELDFAGRMVRFYDPKRFEVPKEVAVQGEVVTKIELVSNRPFFVRPAHAGSKKKVRLLLDTGAPFPALYSGSSAKKMGIDVAALPFLSSIGGVIGRTGARLYEDPDFQLGPFALGPVSTLVAPRGFFNQGGSDDSLIGYDILSQFKVRIDYKRKRLWLKRVNHDPVTFGGADAAMMRKTGAYVVAGADGSWRVMGVLAASPAERFGIRPDDYINIPAIGESAIGPEQIARAVLEGGELSIARVINDVLVDLVLPESSLPAVSAED